MEETFKIDAFRAIDNPKECIEYAEGHESVLAHYGIKKITSSNKSWMNDSGVYVFVVKDQNEKVVGGARIHIANQESILPIEQAIKPIDNSISSLIHSEKNQRVGEICAIWNSKVISGCGISFVLIRSCIAKSGIILANQLKLNKLFALCAPWTVKMFQNVGYEIYTDIGEQGTYPYPKPDLRATVMMINDTDSINLANSLDKQIIFELRKNPRKDSLEKGPKGQLNLKYNLIISTIE